MKDTLRTRTLSRRVILCLFGLAALCLCAIVLFPLSFPLPSAQGEVLREGGSYAYTDTLQCPYCSVSFSLSNLNLDEIESNHKIDDNHKVIVDGIPPEKCEPCSLSIELTAHNGFDEYTLPFTAPIAAHKTDYATGANVYAPDPGTNATTHSLKCKDCGVATGKEQAPCNTDTCTYIDNNSHKSTCSDCGRNRGETPHVSNGVYTNTAGSNHTTVCKDCRDSYTVPHARTVSRRWKKQTRTIRKSIEYPASAVTNMRRRITL